MKHSRLALIFLVLAGSALYAFWYRYLSPKRQLNYLLRRHLL
jgi:hypothetical protein